MPAVSEISSESYIAGVCKGSGAALLVIEGGCRTRWFSGPGGMCLAQWLHWFWEWGCWQCWTGHSLVSGGCAWHGVALALEWVGLLALVGTRWAAPCGHMASSSSTSGGGVAVCDGNHCTGCTLVPGGCAHMCSTSATGGVVDGGRCEVVSSRSLLSMYTGSPSSGASCPLCALPASWSVEHCMGLGAGMITAPSGLAGITALSLFCGHSGMMAGTQGHGDVYIGANGLQGRMLSRSGSVPLWNCA